MGNEKVIVGSVGADSVDFVDALKLLPSLDMKHFTKIVMLLSEFKEAWSVHKSLKHLKILLKP